MPEVQLTAEQREELQRSRVADAYKRLFGADDKTRSEVQRIVWDDLQKVGYAKTTVFIADAKGALCPMRAAFADGRRWVILYVEANVQSTLPSAEPQQQQRKR